MTSTDKVPDEVFHPEPDQDGGEESDEYELEDEHEEEEDGYEDEVEYDENDESDGEEQEVWIHTPPLLLLFQVSHAAAY
jgi:hypothetical protein